MAVSDYLISNDVDPNVPNSFPISGALVGVDTSGLLAPKVVQIDTDLFLVSPAGSYTQAALDILFKALVKAAGLDGTHDGAGGSQQIISGHVATALPAAALTPLVAD